MFDCQDCAKTSPKDCDACEILRTALIEDPEQKKFEEGMILLSLLPMQVPHMPPRHRRRTVSLLSSR
jgi:hypothetical protein